MSAPSVAESPVHKVKAVRTAGGLSIDDLTFDEVDIRAPGPGQVLVTIKAVSLNFRDLLTVTGRYGRRVSKPLVIASDGCGEVVAIGDGVTRFRAGDRVAGSFFQKWISGPFERPFSDSALGGGVDGVLAEQRVFGEEGLVHIPAHFNYEEGATLPCAAVTAWNALVPGAHVQAGGTVLLLGTGGVSIFGLQFAKLHGARVIITSSSDEKLKRAKALGADEIINYKTTSEWDQEVLRLTEGRGADIVLEVGGAGTFTRSMASLKTGGHIMVIGVLSGVTEKISISQILRENIRMRGIYVGSVAMFEDMNRAIATNRLQPVIDRRFTFEQTGEALRCMESAQHFGKIVISLAK